MLHHLGVNTISVRVISTSRRYTLSTYRIGTPNQNTSAAHVVSKLRDISLAHCIGTPHRYILTVYLIGATHPHTLSTKPY